MIDPDDLDALVAFGKKCQGVLVSCTSRVDDLEAYALASDKQLENLSQELAIEKAKPRFKLLYFVPPFVVGLVAGILITR